MGALKIRVSKPTSSELYLSEAQREGRATLQEVSMDILGKPDVRLQARSEIDMGWVRQLDASYEIKGEIEPAVLFWDKKLEKYWLADGFHRHAMCKARRLRSIKAWVIPGDFKEATLFAVTTNQRGCLPRKEADYKKILFMLFDADVSWLEATLNSIRDYTGISPKTVSNWRAVYCQETSRPVPVSARVKKQIGEVTITKSKSRGTDIYVGTARGEKTKYLGATLELAKQKAANFEADLKSREASQKSSGPSDLSVASLAVWLTRRGVVARSCGNAPLSGLGQAFIGPGLVATSMVSEGTEALLLAVGRVLLNKVGRPESRMIVVTAKAPNSQAARNAETLGVEFLTPDELVSSLKEAANAVA